jgi:hypothetical protein
MMTTRLAHSTSKSNIKKHAHTFTQFVAEAPNTPVRVILLCVKASIIYDIICHISANVGVDKAC